MVEIVTSFVLGSLVGAIATITGSYFLLWRHRQAAIAHLRQAFQTELASLSYVDELADAGEYETLAAAVETPVIYQSNADDIGNLSGQKSRRS